MLKSIKIKHSQSHFQSRSQLRSQSRSQLRSQLLKRSHSQSQRTVFWLTLITLGMFGFSFVMIPIYTVFCKITGLNGKIDLNQAQKEINMELSQNEQGRLRIATHIVTVEFDSNQHQSLALTFKPEHKTLQVIPGKVAATRYYVKNLTDKKVILQAIPSISPGIVAKYLKKLECFCFTQQELQPFESAYMPLRFWLEPEFPHTIHRMTLSYTVFDVTNKFYVPASTANKGKI